MKKNVFEDQMIIQLNVTELQKIVESAIEKKMKLEEMEDICSTEYIVGLADLARYLHCSIPYAAKFLRNKMQPDTYTKIGKTFRIRKKAVDAYLHGNKRFRS